MVVEAFPRAEVRVFALVRTMGHVPEIDDIYQPCVGEVLWRDGEAEREP